MDLTAYDLVIFDKDGTLIDFHAMWSGWIESVVAGLERATGLALAADLYTLIGYDAATRRTLPGGPLAASTMAHMAGLMADFLAARGFTLSEAVTLVASAWQVPDPVATARPCADLPALFASLRRRGLKLAVATTDDRAPTLATLAAFGVTDLLDQVVCGDDGLPAKPAPDMVTHICAQLGIAPGRAVVVGDTLFDMGMARAAGAGAVGVLTGVTPRAELDPMADRVLNHIGELEI